MNSGLRICYAGTYERHYPRNRLMIEAFREAGAKVEEANVPVFERVADKSRMGRPQLLGLIVRLFFAYLRLIPETVVRMVRCDVLAIGYIGQLDMLCLGSLTRIMRKPVIFNPLVTLTGTLVEDRHLIAAGSHLARLIRLLDILSLRLATCIISDTFPNAIHLHNQFNVPMEKIVIVPVGADESIFFPEPPDDAIEELNILFYGKFIPLHGIETIVKAAALLQEQDHSVRFELVGVGQQRNTAEDLAAELEVRHIVWTDWIPFNELGERIRQADVVLGIFSGGPKASRVVPNKVYQAMACGAPVITRSSPAMDWLLGEEFADAVLQVPPDSPEELARAILQLNDRQSRSQLGMKGYRAWQMKASMPVQAKRLTPLLLRLRQEGSPGSQNT